jgi:hypothetical protein
MASFMALAVCRMKLFAVPGCEQEGRHRTEDGSCSFNRILRRRLPPFKNAGYTFVLYQGRLCLIPFPFTNVMMNTTKKTSENPLSAGTLIVSILTGLLVFLNNAFGLSPATHLWLSCLFVAAVAIHVAVNWKQFT